MTTALTRPSPSPDPPGGRARRRWPWVPILLVLAGVVVLLYPVAATTFNNAKQREFAAEYDRQTAHEAPAALEADLAAARAYNATLDGVPILDPWLTQASGAPPSVPYRRYLAVLARFEVMARVRVPSVGIDLPVYHGTSDEVLARGAGHLYGTSLPVGGPSTHAVLTSHTGLSTATLFDHLSSIHEGDLMYIDVSGETLAYQVDQIKVVLPNHIDDLTLLKGQDLLTLFTCTPYAINTHRLLVRGHRVPYVAAADHSREVARSMLEPWMYYLLTAAAFGILVAAFIVVRERRRRRVRRRTHVDRNDPPTPGDASRLGRGRHRPPRLP